MGQIYAPERRKVLALQVETPPAANGLIVPAPRGLSLEPGRQTALSIPESVRALGEPLEPFFGACGGRQSISLSVRRRDRPAPAKTFVFNQPFILIGRCQESDLPLNDPRVNFRHIYLQLVAGRWLFVDLGLISGAAAGERGRSASGWFDPASELVVGPYVITHVALDSGTIVRRAGSDSGQTPNLPLVHLEFINGRGKSRRGQMRKILGPVTLLGGSRQCDLWLRDESVSKVHASFVLTQDGLWVVDLLGRDGVLVDDRAAYWKNVHDGSLVTIGRFQLRVRFGAIDREPVRAAGRGRDPEVLPAADRHKSSRGALSEDSVMAMFQQMTEMQNQFFEQSHVQMQLMAQMLAHLGRSQQDSVRKDLSRIDEIGRELDSLRSQLASAPAGDLEKQETVGNARKRRGRKARREQRARAQLQVTLPQNSNPEDSKTAQPLSGKPAVAPSQTPSRHVEPSIAQPANPLAPAGREGSARENAAPRADGSQYDANCIPPATTEAHARLTKRMARLAQERNSRWRRVLNAFGRKPE